MQADLKAVLLYFILIFFLGTVLLFGYQSNGNTFSSAGEHQDILIPYGKSPIFSLVKWDSLWYLKIAKLGYFSPESRAFAAPLFPWLIALLHNFIPNLVTAGFLINILLLPLLCYIFLKYLELDFSVSESFNVVAAFLSFPFSFFLLLPFTETLFLALALTAFYCSRNSRPRLAYLFAFLSALARYPGVIVLITLAVAPFLRLWGKRQTLPVSAWKKQLTSLVVAAIFLSLLFFVWFRLGFFEPNNLTKIRSHWQVTLRIFPTSLLDFPGYIGNGGGPYLLFLGSLVAGGLFLTLKYLDTLRAEEAIYLVLSFVFSLSKQDFGLPIPGSVGRYLLTFFPLFIILGTRVLTTPGRRHAYLFISLTFFVFNFGLYLSNFFVG